MNMLRDMLQPTRRNMLRGMFTSTSALTRFAVNGVEAALALDFIGGEYRTANTSTTFADAFTGNSPKLTYSTAAGSNSTMVNSAGEIVWAPHNLALNSATPATQTIAVRSGAQYTVRVTGAGSMALSGAGTGTATDGSPATITASTTSLTITLTGSLDTVAVYRSDLGGMAPVPGAVGDFQYYVPTNGAAVYLPRVGHHVYNGSTWVNEGLLIESEPRTNLFTHSDFSSGWGETGVDPIALDETGPDGQANTAVTLNEDSAAGEHKLNALITGLPASTYTSSVFVKLKPSDTRTKIRLENSNFTPSNNYGDFDLSAGTVTKGFAADNATIENVGNGWFRCSVTSTGGGGPAAIITVYLLDASGNTSYTGDGASGVLIYGAQFEQGQVVNGTPVDAPTPSSYMPTSGGTYTRTAQSLTVPPAQFGWPEPEYIGPELVENGDFSLGDNGDWIAGGLDGSSITFNSGVARLYGNALAYQTIPTVAGRVYYAQFEITDATISGASDFRVGTSANGFDIYDQTPNVGVGSYSVAFVATSSTTFITLKTHYTTGDLSSYTDFDNISVREINPLSVSIQMDGRMTYADEDTNFTTVTFANWEVDTSNYIRPKLDTYDVNTGKYYAFSRTGGANYGDASEATEYQPGVLVPFNIAGRWTSTEVEAGQDGIASGSPNTVSELLDLSSTDLQIAHVFMGTIGTFRQFAGDIGDTGLVTATNPSTEPTLSLTFDGTGGSFYNLNWSE